MNKSLSRQAKLNAISSYLSFGLTSVLSFFISPLLVTFLGSYYFGIWKLCQKYLDFATIADGRASQALKWIVANHEGEEKSVIEKKQAVGSALYVWFYFLPLLIVIVGGIVYFLPDSINELKPEDIELVRYVGAILGLNILFNPLFGIPDAVLVGINESHKSNYTQIIWIALSNVGMVIAAYFGYGILGMAIVILVATILKGISVLYICRINTPWFGIHRPEKAQVKSFFGFSVWILIWSFIQRLLASSEMLLIGYFLGASLVSDYVFSSYLAQLGVALALMSGSAIMPGLGRVFGKKDFKRAREIISMTRELVLFVAVLFGVLILSGNEAFVKLWVGEEYFVGNVNNLLIVLLMIQLTLLKLEGQIQDISLKIKNKVLWGLIGTVSSLLMAIILYYFVESSMKSIFAGIIIGRLTINFIFPKLVDKITQYNKANIKAYILGALFLVASYFLSSLIISDNWLILIFKLSVLGILTIVLAYLMLLSSNTREFLLHRVIKQK